MTATRFILVLALGATVATAGPALRQGKLIMTGWDSPDTAQFRRDVQVMEQWPFAGIKRIFSSL